MKLRAKFIGKNPSLGYIVNEQYDLLLVNNRIERLDGTGVCVYSNIESFLDNWKIITQINLKK